MFTTISRNLHIEEKKLVADEETISEGIDNYRLQRLLRFDEETQEVSMF